VHAATRNSGGSLALDRDTIAAIATAPGRGGIGIVRISGARARAVATALVGGLPATRRAAVRSFRDAQGVAVDQGVVLFFAGPASFTGEDVVELQGHGGPVVLDLLLEAALAAGARMARPGEFTERAYLNGRIDLAQAEAVADLIASGSRAGVRSAMRSLSGEFSKRIDALSSGLTELRLHVEAAIDFPEEEIDFLAESNVRERIRLLQHELAELTMRARQGALQNEGMTVVIAGRPNAGKSSLLNRLAGYDRAIVTAIPGTTRDTLSERILIDGLPLRIVDTAGLRTTDDPVEREGVRRARVELAQADRILLVCDASTGEDPITIAREEQLPLERLTVVMNKIDIASPVAGEDVDRTLPCVHVSALTGAGFDALAHHLKAAAGWRDDEGAFSARRRHLDALRRAGQLIEHGLAELESHSAAELLAEDLRLAHDALGEIVGHVSSDDLLGRIFASFCIGK
jgi:tRNA modification GTPase